jgi:glutamate/tyrosine decarboxylase-like PLP-dependent enzyme
LEILAEHVDYLNPAEDDPDETLNLVANSLQTTRRFDALKVFVTLRALGIDTVARMIESTVEAAYAASRAAAAITGACHRHCRNQHRLDSMDVTHHDLRCPRPRQHHDSPTTGDRRTGIDRQDTSRRRSRAETHLREPRLYMRNRARFDPADRHTWRAHRRNPTTTGGH